MATTKDIILQIAKGPMQSVTVPLGEYRYHIMGADKAHTVVSATYLDEVPFAGLPTGVALEAQAEAFDTAGVRIGGSDPKPFMIPADVQLPGPIVITVTF